jgi:hypothetical protein
MYVQTKKRFVHHLQGAAVLLGKYTRTRKINTAQLKILRFYYFKKNMKAMVII